MMTMRVSGGHVSYTLGFSAVYWDCADMYCDIQFFWGYAYTYWDIQGHMGIPQYGYMAFQTPVFGVQ